MDEEFDIVKIIKDLRDMKTILKDAGILNDEAKLKAANSGYNVIVLDENKNNDEDDDASFSDPSKTQKSTIIAEFDTTQAKLRSDRPKREPKKLNQIGIDLEDIGSNARIK